MQIKVLGTRGEIRASAPYHSKHSGVLLDKTLLLDLGESEFLRYKPMSVFVTHLHPDHAFFVTETVFRTNILIYAPEKGRTTDMIAVIDYVVEIGPYRVTSVPTHHSKLVKSSAYLIESGEKKLLYTGDMIFINKEYHHLLNNLDLVITEGSYIRKGGLVKRDKETGQIFGHTSIPDLIDLFKPFTSNILLTHFGSWFYEDIKASRKTLDKLGQSKGMKVSTSYDGLELRI